MVGDDLKSKSADLMKKVLTVGVGAVFLTEESLRAMVSEWKLPKEVISAILESSRKTKNEFLQSLSQDVFAKVIDKADPAKLLQEFLTHNEIEFHIKLGIKPKKQDDL
jgi:glycerol-3-phosphate cytidylyltransferase-like family protein